MRLFHFFKFALFNIEFIQFIYLILQQLLTSLILFALLAKVFHLLMYFSPFVVLLLHLAKQVMNARIIIYKLKLILTF